MTAPPTPCGSVRSPPTSNFTWTARSKINMSTPRLPGSTSPAPTTTTPWMSTIAAPYRPPPASLTTATAGHWWAARATCWTSRAPGAAQAVSQDTYTVRRHQGQGDRGPHLHHRGRHRIDHVRQAGADQRRDSGRRLRYDPQSAPTRPCPERPRFCDFPHRTGLPQQPTFETVNVANKGTAKINCNNGGDTIILELHASGGGAQHASGFRRRFGDQRAWSMPPPTTTSTSTIRRPASWPTTCSARAATMTSRTRGLRQLQHDGPVKPHQHRRRHGDE